MGKILTSIILPALGCGAILTATILGYALKPGDTYDPDPKILKSECNYVNEKVTNLATENKDNAMQVLLRKVEWCKDEDELSKDTSTLLEYFKNEDTLPPKLLKIIRGYKPLDW